MRYNYRQYSECTNSRFITVCMHTIYNYIIFIAPHEILTNEIAGKASCACGLYHVMNVCIKSICNKTLIAPFIEYNTCFNMGHFGGANKGLDYIIYLFRSTFITPPSCNIKTCITL